MSYVTLFDSDRIDLDPVGQQLELYQALLHAVGGDFTPPARRGGRDKCTEYRNGGVRDVVAWFTEQTWCSEADRLVVARFWGGDELSAQLAARLEKLDLAVAA